MRVRVAFAASIAILLTNCDASEVETQQRMAELACLTQSWVVQGYARRGAEGELEDTGKIADLEPRISGERAPRPRFRFVSTGQFEIDYGRVSQFAPMPAFELKCTGDFNKGLLTSVQVNGKLHRPASGEVWPIDKL